jgi:hypothetical protein
MFEVKPIGMVRSPRKDLADDFWGKVDAEIALADAQRQKLEAQHQEAEAKQQTEISLATVGFLADMLASADPDKMLGGKVTVVQAIEAAVKDQSLDDYYAKALNLIASGRARDAFGVRLRFQQR